MTTAKTPRAKPTPAPKPEVEALPEGHVRFRVNKFGDGMISKGAYDAQGRDTYFSKGDIIVIETHTALSLEARKFGEIEED